jgi:hypothetical protein
VLSLFGQTCLQPKVLLAVRAGINANSNQYDPLTVQVNVSDLAATDRMPFAKSLANRAFSRGRGYYERIVANEFQTAAS